MKKVRLVPEAIFVRQGSNLFLKEYRCIKGLAGYVYRTLDMNIQLQGGFKAKSGETFKVIYEMLR